MKRSFLLALELNDDEIKPEQNALFEGEGNTSGNSRVLPEIPEYFRKSLSTSGNSRMISGNSRVLPEIPEYFRKFLNNFRKFLSGYKHSRSFQCLCRLYGNDGQIDSHSCLFIYVDDTAVSNH